MCLYEREKDKLKRIKHCIINYYKYNLGEEVPSDIKYCVTLDSLSAFMYIYNIKENEINKYKDIQ
jgi:hypothetical protein